MFTLIDKARKKERDSDGDLSFMCVFVVVLNIVCPIFVLMFFTAAVDCDCVVNCELRDTFCFYSAFKVVLIIYLIMFLIRDVVLKIVSWEYIEYHHQLFLVFVPYSYKIINVLCFFVDMKIVLLDNLFLTKLNKLNNNKPIKVFKEKKKLDGYGCKVKKPDLIEDFIDNQVHRFKRLDKIADSIKESSVEEQNKQLKDRLHQLETLSGMYAIVPDKRG
jgi:hypothetical protein